MGYMCEYVRKYLLAPPSTRVILWIDYIGAHFYVTFVLRAL